MDESWWKGQGSASQDSNGLLSSATGDSTFENHSDQQHMDQRKITAVFIASHCSSLLNQRSK